MHHDFVGDRSFSRRRRYNVNAVFLRLFSLESFIGLVEHLNLAISHFVLSSFESTRNSLITTSDDLDFCLVRLVS